MKVVILAGGYGTRMGSETETKPKPMVEVGGKPILWHLLKLYEAQGFRDFVLALGYKGELVKHWMLNYHYYESDLTVSTARGEAKVHGSGNGLDATVTLVNTGLEAMTGGRLHALRPHLGRETFMLTYGDGLANVDLRKLVAFHHAHGRIATVTAVRPVARFGNITLDHDRVSQFKEKVQTAEGWINGGFFVFEPGIFDYLEGPETVLEGEPLERLAADGQLMAHQHGGFWQCMDTPRDQRLLEQLWASGAAPWKVW